ncbi:MAG: metal-dependent hydrolase [Nitrospiraceae bacterium]|nr:metal-dependent hydrolase [Nitrospiraceae bacterium]
MHIPTHLALSWIVAHPLKERRDRSLVAWAGVLPDVDGLTILAGLDAYGRWHHMLTHGAAAAVITATVLAFFGKHPVKVWWLSLLTFHLHLVCDLVGSGIGWPLAYWWPFAETLYPTPYGWELGAWQNSASAAAVLVACGYLATQHGYSFAETFLPKACDAKVVAALQHRFCIRPHADTANPSPAKAVDP